MGFVAHFIRSQQRKNFENRLRFDKVTESLKVRTLIETECTSIQGLPYVLLIYDDNDMLWDQILYARWRLALRNQQPKHYTIPTPHIYNLHLLYVYQLQRPLNE